MATGKFYTGSICLTDILENAKAGHSSFSRSEKNQKVYFNVKMWVNEDADQYGNHAQLLLNQKPDKEQDKIYIGNFKLSEKKEPTEMTTREITEMATQIDDDLPF
mgnify:CR=1 FL=1